MSQETERFPAAKCHRFQIGLGTMLLLVALAGVMVFAVVEHRKRIHVERILRQQEAQVSVNQAVTRGLMYLEANQTR